MELTTMPCVACIGNLDKVIGFVEELADRLSLPDPNTKADILECKIGGLSVYLNRKLIDDVSYQRKDERNILRMVLQTRNAEALS